jgi:rubrerythrin
MAEFKYMGHTLSGAAVQGVLEGVEYQMNESGIIEKKVIEEALDEYSKLIKEAQPEEINEAIKTIFSDYLKKLKN